MKTSGQFGLGGQSFGQDSSAARPQQGFDAPPAQGRLGPGSQQVGPNPAVHEAWLGSTGAEVYPTGQMIDEAWQEPAPAINWDRPQQIDEDVEASARPSISLRALIHQAAATPSSWARSSEPGRAMDGAQHRELLRAASVAQASFQGEANSKWLAQSNALGGYLRAFMSMRSPGG
jgi:hypothetical protein